MRVLLDYRPALRERTGVGEYVHELARALVATAPADETLTLFSSSLRDRLDASGVPGARAIDRRVPVRALNFAWHRLGVPPVEWLATGRFDIVQGAHPLLIPTSRAARLLTICDLDFLDHPERTRGEIRRDYPHLAARHAKRADQIVVISRFTANEVVRRFGVDPNRITIGFPGAPAWTPRPREPEAGHILFLGTLDPRKNVGLLLDAYARLVARSHSMPPLVLAGHITDDAAPIVERLQTSPFRGRVVATGYVTTERRLELFQNASVFVFPSFTEGFGMPALEAMTCGVPVIAANRGALPEVVGTAGRLIEPDTVDELAQAIDAVLRDRTLRQTMTDAGLKQSRKFRWTDTARNVREAWGAAIEHRKAARG